MSWWQTPAFSTGRMAAVVLFTIVTITELAEALR
jgi:hypothetical protein